MVEHVFGGVSELFGGSSAKKSGIAVFDQRIAGRKVKREFQLPSIAQSGNPACLQRGDQEPELGDGYGKGIEIYTVDRIEGEANSLVAVAARGLIFPLREYPAESAENEVARAAGRIDHLNVFVAELL